MPKRCFFLLCSCCVFARGGVANTMDHSLSLSLYLSLSLSLFLFLSLSHSHTHTITHKQTHNNQPIKPKHAQHPAPVDISDLHKKAYRVFGYLHDTGYMLATHANHFHAPRDMGPDFDILDAYRVEGPGAIPVTSKASTGTSTTPDHACE